jgi:hypothetical protein
MTNAFKLAEGKSVYTDALLEAYLVTTSSTGSIADSKTLSDAGDYKYSISHHNLPSLLLPLVPIAMHTTADTATT